MEVVDGFLGFQDASPSPGVVLSKVDAAFASGENAPRPSAVDFDGLSVCKPVACLYSGFST